MNHLASKPFSPRKISRILQSFFPKNYIFIFWLCWVFITTCRLSLVVASKGHPLVVVCTLWWSTGSRQHYSYKVASVVSNSVRPHGLQPTRLLRPWDSPGKNTGMSCHFLLHAWKWKVKVKLLSRVRLLATPWTEAYQAPPSMGFSGQQYWSGVPLPDSSNCCSPAPEHRLSSCAALAWLPSGMWNPPDLRLNTCPLHWQVDFQLLKCQGSPQKTSWW